MKLISLAFENNAPIPRKYSAFGENVNPPLRLDDLPEETKSLVIIMDDPDVPASAGVKVFDHWVVFNIVPESTSYFIPEQWQPAGVLGQGTRGQMGYAGPKPPDREHRYFFQAYALDALLSLPAGSTKQELQEAMSGHILDQAELVGRYAPGKT
jgi:Raf kinase inhibitor-like YbhB/YbcL family protein